MTPVAGLIVIRPGIKVKTIEGNTLHADTYHWNAGAHIAIEAVLVHAEIRRRIAQADEWWHLHRTRNRHGAYDLRVGRLAHDLPRLRVEHGRWGRGHGVVHSNGRQGCRGEGFAQRTVVRMRSGGELSGGSSRESQSSTSDRNQPTCRPRYWRICGNRRTSVRPQMTSFGRRVRRATS